MDRICKDVLYGDEKDVFPDDQMLVLDLFCQEAKNEEGNIVSCDGWVFTSLTELRNLYAVLRCQYTHGLSVAVDATYKILHNGWAMTNLISESIVDSNLGM